PGLPGRRGRRQPLLQDRVAALALGGVVVGLEGRQLRDGGRRDRPEGRELEPARRRLAGWGEPAERRAGGPAVVEEKLGVARPRPAARKDVGPPGRQGCSEIKVRSPSPSVV